ncbi:MAG TPA: DUF1003 domain-containing protein [Cytophagaceae bacterium]|jgi:uncharacterized membrane protein|nr:DUF1003 domain-containing protein [Cytophagaceae bacterium]
MNEQKTCSITGKSFDTEELTKGDSLHTGVFSLIKKDFPDFEATSWINNTTLNEYRKKYLETIIKEEFKDLDRMEKDVISSITKNEILSTNIEDDMEQTLSSGQRVADKIASFGGSWTFITLFFAFIIIWILMNIWLLSTKPFDPYPFILLNLLLSCIAAIQAPIIMMSQNRKEEKDRGRSENDFKVNLKAELEIRLLHEKVDHMIMHQNQKLLEIQEIQMDFISEILTELKNKK